ncbi:MAG TPA: DUF4397 domain-containing protein [Blastocatellia bacterium]|nr:DUF4397 domain-containing protein [Blastocatellia bacterium]
MNSRKVFSLGVATALVFMAACSPESQRTEPVTTTTDKGASTAPPAKEAAKADKALVRVVNALPGSAPVDAFVGDTKEFNNVAYKAVTPYKETPDVQRQFTIRPAGQDRAQPLAQNTEGISGGDHYTAIAMPAPDGQAKLRVVADDLTPPSTGKASVRFINASPDAGELDIFVKGKDDALFSGVDPDKVTDYKEIDPMTGALEARPQGKTNVLLTVPAMKFEPGHLYTIILTGKAKGAPKLEAVKIDDRLDASAGAVGASPTVTPRKRQ